MDLQKDNKITICDYLWSARGSGIMAWQKDLQSQHCNNQISELRSQGQLEGLWSSQ